MTNEQNYRECVLLAPDFRVGVEYPTVGRSLVWRGTPTGSLSSLSAGLEFPPDSPFEPRLTALLQQAVVTLRQAVG